MIQFTSRTRRSTRFLRERQDNTSALVRNDYGSLHEKGRVLDARIQVLEGRDTLREVIDEIAKLLEAFATFLRDEENEATRDA